ncbi:MAG: HEPN domain-containing protein [Marinobacterium sp.]|nr:HEPN domain-containing protein [Marinobacterium sp.]
MKTSIDHLPAAKQRDLDYIVRVIHDEFAQVTDFAEGKRKHSRILKIILFGSHATGKWVYDPANGYLSDYDILVILNDQCLKDGMRVWNNVESRLLQQLKPPVTLIVHTLQEVNDALAEGQYFFSDIKKEGIALYELEPSRALASACNLTPAQAREIAQRHYQQRIKAADGFMEFTRFGKERENYTQAAFLLHQACESYYACIMLVFTNYMPATHNLVQLNSLAILQHERFAEVFPQTTRQARNRFQLLKRAYVDARYSEHYEINAEQLDWLIERVEVLQQLTKALCLERIEGFVE